MSFGFDNLVKQDKRFERSPYLSLMASDVGFLLLDFVSIDAETKTIVLIVTNMDTIYNLRNGEYKILISISDI